MAVISEIHEMFAQHAYAAEVPVPQRRYALCLQENGTAGPAGEVWLDFAWPDWKIAAQIDRNEQRIYEQAVRYIAEEQGWRVCFFTGQMVTCGQAIATIVAMFPAAGTVRSPIDRLIAEVDLTSAGSANSSSRFIKTTRNTAIPKGR